MNFVESVLGLKLEISKGIKGTFVIIKNAGLWKELWNGSLTSGGCPKIFEILTATAENMLRVAMIKITLAKCV